MKVRISLLVAMAILASMMAGCTGAPDDDATEGSDLFSNPETATQIGTEGPEEIDGTEGDDVIFGLGGDDVIRAHGGNDIVCGGPGNDLLGGGPGDDHLDGGEGQDQCNGGPGSNMFVRCEVP